MKVIRFLNSKGSICWGIQEGTLITKIEDDLYNEIRVTKDKFNIDEIKLLAPCAPTKIIGLGLNFKECYSDGQFPSEPIMFLKGPNTLIGHKQKIVYPKNINYAWAEAELVIVIKSKAKSISQQEAKDYIFGHTIGNDITAENIYNRDHHLARSKSIDTFAPIGPHI